MAKPSITGTTHTLPFNKLSPLDFERLCLWLVQREGYERAEHLGAAGAAGASAGALLTAVGPRAVYQRRASTRN